METKRSLSAREVDRLLDVIEEEILPLTEVLVTQGHNLFGAAVLDGVTLRTLTVGSNRRGDNPVYHGEIDTILRFFELPHRPGAEETLFLATHEPCAMCLSALAWSGFREVWHLFDYDETASDFHMADDLKMLESLFGTTSPNRDNAYFRLRANREALDGLEAGDRKRLEARIARIKELYRELPVVLDEDEEA
jgi:tRNA(Arg) A34 adenosine deaminase TadA